MTGKEICMREQVLPMLLLIVLLTLARCGNQASAINEADRTNAIDRISLQNRQKIFTVIMELME